MNNNYNYTIDKRLILSFSSWPKQSHFSRIIKRKIKWLLSSYIDNRRHILTKTHRKGIITLVFVQSLKSCFLYLWNNVKVYLELLERQSHVHRVGLGDTTIAGGIWMAILRRRVHWSSERHTFLICCDRTSSYILTHFCRVPDIYLTVPCIVLDNQNGD